MKAKQQKIASVCWRLEWQLQKQSRITKGRLFCWDRVVWCTNVNNFSMKATYRRERSLFEEQLVLSAWKQRSRDTRRVFPRQGGLTTCWRCARHKPQWQLTLVVLFIPATLNEYGWVYLLILKKSTANEALPAWWQTHCISYSFFTTKASQHAGKVRFASAATSHSSERTESDQ